MHDLMTCLMLVFIMILVISRELLKLELYKKMWKYWNDLYTIKLINYQRMIRELRDLREIPLNIMKIQLYFHYKWLNLSKIS